MFDSEGDRGGGHHALLFLMLFFGLVYWSTHASTIPWVCYRRRNQWLRLALALDYTMPTHAFFLFLLWLQCIDPHHKDLLVFCTLLELQSWAIAYYYRHTVVGIDSA